MEVVTPVPSPQDQYDAATIAGFRAAGYWHDDVLAACVDRRAAEDPSGVVVTDGYGALTAAELRGSAYRLAAALMERGVGPGDRVQVQLPNWNEFVVVYVALARIGAVLVPTMPIYRHDEVRYAIEHSGARVSIVPGDFRKFDYAGMLAELRASGLDLDHVITVRADAGAGDARFEDLVAGVDIPGDDVLGPPPAADDLHCIIYTSGTESRPKGCVHTFNTVTYTVHALGADVMGLGPGDVMFMPSPITHATGLVMGVTTPLILGAAIHLMDAWEPKAALARIAEHRCTASMTATPFLTMALGVLDGTDDVSSLRVWVSAGAPIPETLLTEWKSRMPSCALLPVYGRSEGLLVTACRLDDPPEKVVSSDGKAFPGVVLEIRGEDGSVLAPGAEGEICHGGPGLMLGYWQDPERTAAAIDDRGVSASGDLGRVDEDGFMRVTGRIKDLIIRGGTNISAREIEEHLLTHPKVANVAAVSVPDDRLGEKVGVFVVAKGEPPTLAELGDYLRNERQISVHKLPEYLFGIDELPTTATGKVQKFLLRDMAAAELKG